MSRWWPASLYVLATVLAHGLHNHHGAETAARCEASCADARTHFSGHPAPDLGHSPTDCLACQYRADHHCGMLAPPVFFRPGVAFAFAESSSPAVSRPAIPISCRAPPRV